MLLGVFFFILSQCTAPETRIEYYFDVQSQLENKVSTTEEQAHPVVKSVLINGKKEENTLPIKNWKKELAMFLSLDLNRPALQGKYNTSDFSASEKNYKVYKAIDPDVSIRYLRIELDTKDSANLVGLYAQVSQKNYLYQTAKTLELQCSEKDIIKYYKIEGYEKILFQSKKQYVVKGSIMD